jgi:hypothetical protein
MRRFLILLFTAVLALMAYVTITASLEQNLVAATRSLWPDAWFRATLADAYCGFLTFFAWVAYKETRWGARIGWFAGIMVLGNLAMAAYVLRELLSLPAASPLQELLVRRR